MNYPFKKNHLRLLSLTLCLVLAAGMFAGCMNSKAEETTGSTEDNLPPGLVEVKPTEETTTPTETTVPLDENAAVINKDDTKVRQTPSADANPIGTLDKGTQVTIIREVSIANVGWTLIREGWVTTDSLDRSYVPDDKDTEGSDTSTPTEPDDTTTNNKDTDTNKDSNTSAGNTTSIMAVVTASELNIRKDADQNSDRLGAYKYGDRITILETKNGWGRTNKGWISLNYVYQDGTKGANGCMGVVTATQLNVRSGPGTNYDKVDSVNYGGRVTVLERVTIDGVSWGCIKGGWISMEHVYVDGTKSTGAGEGTCTGDAVNIRSGPGTGYGSVGSANNGDAITIYVQIKIGDMTWGYVEKGTTKGWMSMQYANMG